MKKILLCILDGFGYSESTFGNATGEYWEKAESNSWQGVKKQYKNGTIDKKTYQKEYKYAINIIIGSIPVGIIGFIFNKIMPVTG